MQYHRPLVQEDVETAHRLLTMHQPSAPDAHDRSYCASAMHYTPALWPCARHRWAIAVLAADERGEIEAPAEEGSSASGAPAPKG